MSETTTGTCKFCHQIRTIEKVQKGLSESERDVIATHECDCDGAKAERDVDYRIQSGKKAIEVIVKNENCAKLFLSALENVARGHLDKVSAISPDGTKYEMSYKKTRISVTSTFTIKKEADGEAID